MTQLADLREHFATPGAKLTAYAAANDLGIARLSPRIGEMELEGYQFLHRMIPAPSRRGKARVAEYVLTALPGGTP
jgi:hypothetical protein